MEGMKRWCWGWGGGGGRICAGRLPLGVFLTPRCWGGRKGRGEEEEKGEDWGRVKGASGVGGIALYRARARAPAADGWKLDKADVNH